MTNTNLLRHVLAALVICGTAACVADSPTTDDPADDPVYTRTVVKLSPDGSHETRVESVTASQQRLEADQRVAQLAGTSAPTGSLGQTSQAISQDWSCGGASLWVYDQFNKTGNEICFTGQGVAFLNDYTRWICTINWQCRAYGWSHAVRSYWAGSDIGHFSEDVSPYSYTPFHAFEEVNVADPVAQNAYLVDLGD